MGKLTIRFTDFTQVFQLIRTRTKIIRRRRHELRPFRTMPSVNELRGEFWVLGWRSCFLLTLSIALLARARPRSGWSTGESVRHSRPTHIGVRGRNRRVVDRARNYQSLLLLSLFDECPLPDVCTAPAELRHKYFVVRLCLLHAAPVESRQSFNGWLNSRQ